MGLPQDMKLRAIEQWTADPCGPEATSLEGLLSGRRAYAPWMAEALDYPGAAGLEVLDAGCGQGIDLCEFALEAAKVTGIDLTPRHVGLARQHLKDLGLSGTVLEGDVENLPFPDSNFDRVTSNGVLHHTPDISQALREIRRVLRPGGRATVIVYNRDSAHYWLQQMLGYGILKGHLWRERSMAGVLSVNVERSSIGARPLVRVYSRRGLRRLLQQAGFTEISVRPSPLRAADTFLTSRLPRQAQSVLARLPLGWYLIANGARVS